MLGEGEGHSQWVLRPWQKSREFVPQSKVLPASIRKHSTPLTDDSFAYCIEDELCGVVQVQFLQNMTAMSLDCVWADIEGCCHFLVRLPFSDKLQDFSFPTRKQIIAVYCAFLLENTDVILS